MSFLNKWFGQKEAPVPSYQDFWSWFQQNEKAFYKVIKNRDRIERDFFDKLAPKLNELKDGFYYVTGMCDENTAELIITAEGATQNIVFVEELIAAAPKLEGWRFTALKPALDIKDVTIRMDGFEFGKDQISFYVNEDAAFPDEINIVLLHTDFTDQNKDTIIQGTYIFLDNYLGELNFVTTIDDIQVIGETDGTKESIPIEKLKDYLIWREKEFLEKYEGVWHDSDEGNYQAMEATLQNGNPFLAIINSDLLEWDSKASHPWIVTLQIPYNGKNNNGMPKEDAYQMLTEIEDEMMDELKASDGYLNVGRQTADNERVVYICSKDFRKPSKILHRIQQEYQSKMPFTFEIYKDKYWQSLDRFRATVE